MFVRLVGQVVVADQVAAASNCQDVYKKFKCRLLSWCKVNYVSDIDWRNTMITMGLSFIHVLIVLGFAWIAKVVEDIRTTEIDDDHLIEEEGFLSLGFRRAGLYLGVFIGLSGSLVGSTAGFKADTKALLIDGVVVLASMFVIRYLFDNRILRKVKNDLEIAKNNIAVGIAECGAYISIGLILNGSFTG